MALAKTNKAIIVLFYLLAALFLTIMTVPASCLAQDSTPSSDIGDTAPDNGTPDADVSGDGDTDGPEFSNPAQAQHAENLASDAATRDEDTIAALDALDEAEKALEAAKKEGDEAKIAEALEAYETAKDLAEAKFAEVAGALESDIASMREAGMGWGQIAHELGVHPGLLGLGHSKHTSSQSSTSARNSRGDKFTASFGDITARNTKTGKSNSHGQASNHSSGKGLGTDKAGEKGASSKGGDHNGSNGHGNGKGDGGNGKGK